MKLPNYADVLKKSFQHIFQHLVLVSPILIGFLLFIAVCLILVAEGLLFIFVLGVSATNIIPSFSGSTLNISLLALFVLFDIFLFVAIGAYTDAMRFGGYYHLINNNRLSFSNMLHYGSKYFGKLFCINILKFLIIVIPLLSLSGLAVLAYYINIILGIVLTILFVMIYITYAFYLVWGLFFLGPIVVSEKLSSIQTIKASFRYLHKEPAFLFLTWVIIFSLGLAAGMISVAITLPIQLLGSFFFPLLFFAILLRILATMVFYVYSDLFKFICYFSFEKQKKK